MKNDLQIAIVGAGIAGLTLSAALWRAGLCSQVFEQAPLLAEVGAGVQVAPNAARVLHRLGLAEHLGAVAVRPEALRMRRWDDGSVLRRTELGDRCARLYGAPYYTAHRADLHRGLVELIPDGNVHLGLRCVSVRQEHDQVTLRFDNGSAVTADVVIGADGIHSVVRETLVSDTPVFSGHSVFRGLIPARRLGETEEPTVTLWLGPNRHCVRYPVSAGKLISFAATTPAGAPSAESWTAEGNVAELAAQYDGWHPDVRRLLAAADVVGRWDLHDRDPLDRWVDGRVAVLGDAAHPMLPFFAQGANQAIEDAAVLAACLRATSDVASALARYEAIRAERTHRVHGVSRDNTRMLHLADGPAQRERDHALAAHADLRNQEWLFGYDADAVAV